MRTVVTGSLSHLCPHVEEVDHGTVEFTFDGPAPELHDLRTILDGYANQRLTHEDLTAELADRFPNAEIVTYWRTAGCDVEVHVP